MRLLITGDLVVNKEYDSSEMIDKKIIGLFSQSDYNIINLEAPITNSDKHTLKTGPNLKSDGASTLEVLRTLKVDAVTLANNHVMDYDEQGVYDTLNFCNSNNIETLGAGMNISDASRTLYINKDEEGVAILNFAENEWVAASTNSAGFNPMSVIENSRKIKEAKLKAKYIIVIVHGGHEYYNLPSPRMVNQYRYYIEQGADVIVGHHTHCISGYEKYKGGTIYYSLGNFLFTKSSSFKDWYIGLILEIDIKSGNITTKLHPIEQSLESFRLSYKSNKDAEEIFERIDSFNEIILDDQKLNKHWDIYVESKMNIYLNNWSPLSFIRIRYLRAILRRLGVNGLNKKGVALKLNLMRCEAHRDLSNAVLNKYLSK